MELNKGERYCSNLILRTLKPCENMKIGDLDVYIKRMDEKESAKIGTSKRFLANQSYISNRSFKGQY